MPNSVARLLRAFLATALVLISEPAFATAQRTFASSTGNDTNPCSIAAPCRGIAAAVAQTSAGGEVIVLDSAGYGAVTITKSVAIIAAPGVYAGVSVLSGDGITVNAPGATVVLRGLSINGQGGDTGIVVFQAARLRIEGCVVSNMALSGVVNLATGSDMAIFDTIVRDNQGNGIALGADASVVLDRVRVEHNNFDGVLILPAVGTPSVTITDSIFANNGSNGININAATAGTITYFEIERSTLSNNGGNGFVASMPAPDFALVYVSLARNAINRNALDGIRLDGIVSPGISGDVFGIASDNSLHGNGGYGFHTLGRTAVHASANSLIDNGLGDIKCDTGSSTIFSSGNNVADYTFSTGACLVLVSGH